MRTILLVLLVACVKEAPAADPHAGHTAPPAAPEATPPASAGETPPASAGETPPASGGEMPGMVMASPEATAALGIRTVPARAGGAPISRRAPAVASFDPTRTSRITTQAGGQLKSLNLPRVGERVAAGSIVARLYEPGILAAFEELRIAGGLGEPWLSAARGRLLNAGVPEADVQAALSATSTPRTYALRSPVSGVVTARPVTTGAWLGPGAVLAEVTPADALVVEMTVSGSPPAIGTEVSLAAGDSMWPARVVSALPTAGAAGRVMRLVVDATVPVGQPLVATWTESGAAGVWIPRSAVVDTGERVVTFVALEPGSWAPRTIVTGERTSDEVQVRSGLTAGENVVVHGAFLLDAETQMTTGGGHAGHGG